MKFNLRIINGIRLHVGEDGPPDGPLVILLHGFPEFWYGWRKQFPALAAAGYRVLVPDQRGYNLSEKPPAVRDYRLDALAADVVGLIESEGRQAASIVGHDWGAAVGWWLAITQPARIERLAVLNVPHPQVMFEHLRNDFQQMLRSWYIGAFQVPWLPEQLGRLGDWRGPTEAMVRTSRPGTFSQNDLATYKTAWSEPGAMRSMINWYRAAAQYRPAMPADARVHVPTLILWGAQDQFLRREMAPPSAAMCDQAELVFLENATHWLQHEEPETVNRQLLDFLGRGRAALNLEPRASAE